MSRFTVVNEQSGKRLDAILAALMPELSRSSINKLIGLNKVTVNQKTVKPSHKLNISDVIDVDFDNSMDQQIPEITLPIVYEDTDCIVIDKPSGILTHSKGAFNPEPTVATFISHKVKNMDDDRAGIVHRLDRDTSGVIICAKNPAALSWLQKQFSSRKVKKTYLAAVSGELKEKEATINMPIKRNPKKPKTFYVNSTGKPAVTNYKVIGSFNNNDVVEVAPETGRTHQLRVHFHKIGHPIIGDKFYDGSPYKRLLLHAYKLELTLPSKKRMTFESKPPVELQVGK